MSNITDFPEIKILLELGLKKKELTIDEINKNLPQDIINAGKIDDVFILLQNNQIRVLEEDTSNIEDIDVEMFSKKKITPEEAGKKKDDNRRRGVSCRRSDKNLSERNRKNRSSRRRRRGRSRSKDRRGGTFNKRFNQKNRRYHRRVLQYSRKNQRRTDRPRQSRRPNKVGFERLLF